MQKPGYEEFEHTQKRRPHILYISKRFSFERSKALYRFCCERFEDGPLKELIRKGDEFVLHETDSGIHQIKARFFENGRGITHLHIQRWNTRTGNQIGDQVVLFGEQITRLIGFLESIRHLEIQGPEGFRVNETDQFPHHMPDSDALKVLEEHPDLVAEFARSQITTEDVVALAYRRGQLRAFANMLARGDDISEGDWQRFFECNQWIFGYGLSYIFTTGLDRRGLQQTIRGSSLVEQGKTPDAIMKTRAAVSALCLVEIKKSSTHLLKKNEYRPKNWAPSAELSGAVAQCQETLRVAEKSFEEYQRFTDEKGDQTGEDLMSVQPRSFLVVGNLGEFRGEHGINTARYRAFEGFRRNLLQPEILTFDELYERARFIVEHAETLGAVNENYEDDIQF